MKRKVRYPYVGVRCPHTSETVKVKEHHDDDDGWVWLYRGKVFSNLDDVLDTRRNKKNK
jgi:hypothetical protein